MSPSTAESGCNDSRDSIVVLGIGNVLWADEGFGVRCVEALQSRWQFGPQVELVDGGTQGLYLLPLVQGARRLLIFDAVDYGLEPGTIQQVQNDEVPRFLGAKKMSLHQTGFQEVLMLALLAGRYPDEVLLIGCQPEQLEDYGGSLSASVKARLEPALDIALARLQAWGAAAVRREAPPTDDEAVTTPSLALAAYEQGRPAADVACRTGDDRFMPATEV